MTEKTEPIPLPDCLNAEKNPDDVLAITILYNKKSCESTIIWPQGQQNFMTLRGMLSYAVEELSKTSVVRAVSQSLKEQLVLAGAKKIIVPSLAGAPPNLRP